MKTKNTTENAPAWTPGEIEAFKLGISEAGHGWGMTYDDDTESPRSIAYDMGRNLGEMDGDNKFKRVFAAAPEMAEALREVTRCLSEYRQTGYMHGWDKPLAEARALLARIGGAS